MTFLGSFISSDRNLDFRVTVGGEEAETAVSRDGMGEGKGRACLKE